MCWFHEVLGEFNMLKMTKYDQGMKLKQVGKLRMVFDLGWLSWSFTTAMIDRGIILLSSTMAVAKGAGTSHVRDEGRA